MASHVDLIDDFRSIGRKATLDRAPITAVCAIDEANLLTGTSLIKWWSWPSKQLLKTFNGHSTEVRHLMPLRFGSDLDTIHFVSTAANDRFISLW